MNYLAIVLAILPIILIGLFFYLKDTLKEPIKLLRNLFLCGIVSAILVISISYITLLIFPNYNDMKNASFLKIFTYSFFFVAFFEELTKWFMVYKISFKHKDFDQMYDIILYSVFVSLGFSFLENLIYIAPAINGLTLAIFRSLTAIPAHVSFGVFIGYYLSFYKKNNNKKYLYLSIIVPIILHGFYDFLFIITILKVNKILKYDKNSLKEKSSN